MRVLFFDPPGGASVFITQGMINALRDIGCVAQRWDGKRDTWDLFSPDVYIGCTGHRQNPPNTRQCQVALHVNPYGPIKIEPNINEPQNAIDWVKTMNPSVVFGYGHETDRSFWSFWDKIGIPWVPMATAADATIFNIAGTHDKCDVGYIGGRWPYKATNIDAYLLPVLRDATISHKVFGWGTWPNGMCSGHIDDSGVPLLYANCRVAPCISEPHTIAHGIDLPERVFKAALSGAVVVHDPAKGLDRYLPHAIAARNPEEFHRRIKELIRLDKDALRAVAEQQRQDVLKAHTYHHRMATLMTALGFNDVASSLLLAVQRLR